MVAPFCFCTEFLGKSAIALVDRIGFFQPVQESLAEAGRQVEDSSAESKPNDVLGSVENRGAVAADAKMFIQTCPKLRIQLPVYIFGDEFMYGPATDFDH
jgi:hypothetical protein